MSVATDGVSPRMGNSQEIFTRPPLGWTLIFNWLAGFDMSADGQRFLINLPVGRNPADHGYILAQNRAAELKRSKRTCPEAGNAFLEDGLLPYAAHAPVGSKAQ